MIEHYINVSLTGSSSDEYIRPDWLDLPTTVDGDEKLLMLYAVFEDSHNFAAFQVDATASVDYQVDWGDGNVETFTSHAVAEHEYDWADVGDYYAPGQYRQAIITVTPTSGQITVFSANHRHSSATNDYNSGFLDVKFTTQGLTSIASAFRSQYEQQHKLLQAFEWVGTCNVTNANYGFYGSNIVYFKGDFTLCTNLSYMFYATTIRWMEMTLPNSGVNATGMFWSTPNMVIFKNDFVNLNGVTNVQSMFRASKIQSFGTADDPIILTSPSMNFMFYQAFNLNSVFISGGSGNCSSSFRDAKALTIVSGLDFGASTNNASTFRTCYSLTHCDVDNATRALDFSDCNFSREGFLNILNGIGTASGAQTLDLSNNPGSGDLTADDILIGTNKGWTVLN